MSNLHSLLGPFGSTSAGPINATTLTVDSITVTTPGGSIDIASTLNFIDGASVTGLSMGPAVPSTYNNGGDTVYVDANDCGAILVNDAGSGSPSFVLPPASNGNYFVYLYSSGAEDCTFTGDGGETFYGRSGGTSTTTGPGGEISGLTVTHAHATALPGDSVTFRAQNGAYYMTQGTGIFSAA